MKTPRHGSGATPARGHAACTGTPITPSESDSHSTAPGAPLGTWLRTAIAEKAANVRGLGIAGMVILTPLGRTDGQHDYTCDRCAAVVPAGLVCGVAQAEPGVHIAFGVCRPCAIAEGVQIDGVDR